jgi:hypothetical protein
MSDGEDVELAIVPARYAVAERVVDERIEFPDHLTVGRQVPRHRWRRTGSGGRECAQEDGNDRHGNKPK